MLTISSVAEVGMDVRAKFGDYRLSCSQIIRLLATPEHFVQYLIAFGSRPEAASEIIICSVFVGQIVSDKLVKFGDPGTNHSREIPPEAIGGWY